MHGRMFVWKNGPPARLPSRLRGPELPDPRQPSLCFTGGFVAAVTCNYGGPPASGSSVPQPQQTALQANVVVYPEGGPKSTEVQKTSELHSPRSNERK
eukprot:1157910-Pelagomonas_calceolata.AAC.1